VGFEGEDAWGLWKVTGRDDRKRTRDETRSLFPASRRGAVNHRWRHELEGLAPEALTYVTMLQTAPVGSECDAILAVLVIGIVASPPPSHNRPNRSQIC